MLINQKLTKAGVAQEPSGEGLLTCCSTTARRPQQVISDVSAPPTRGLFLGFFDEVGAASGACGDWRRDPDGYDGDASAVS